VSLRRPFILEAGESLLVTNDPVRCLANHIGVAKALGIEQRDLIASRMSPMPLPVNGARPTLRSRTTAGSDPRKRIAGLDPSMMWLPTLWLPDRLLTRARYQFVDGDIAVIDDHGYFAGDPRAVTTPIDDVEINTESTDVWVIRVALELVDAGAYDVDAGTWLDVLDTIGINADELDDVRRVERWMSGAADADLDELQATFMAVNPGIEGDGGATWALTSALANYRHLLDATWALSSDKMLDVVDDLMKGVNDGEITEESEAKFVANYVCILAQPLLRWYRDDEADWWHTMAQTVDDFTGSPSELVAGPLTEIDLRLTDVRETTWPRMESASIEFEE
jgi:hypothetical protein